MLHGVDVELAPLDAFDGVGRLAEALDVFVADLGRSLQPVVALVSTRSLALAWSTTGLLLVITWHLQQSSSKLR